MCMSKDKIAEILNANRYAGCNTWSHDALGFIANNHSTLRKLSFEEAEREAQNYMLDQAEKEAIEDESKPKKERDAMGIENDEDGLAELNLIRDCKERSGHFGDAETLSWAFERIKQLKELCLKPRPPGFVPEVDPNAIPSADEALAIINEVEHSDTTWSIVALGHDDNGERNAFLLHAELIGTAMFYKAKGAKS